MKINSNIPIFIILTVFAGSIAFVYQYLNNGYFVDKVPETQNKSVENVIFSLISDHEAVLMKRNEEILLEAERLRNARANITDSEELKAIEAKLRALELEAKKVQEEVLNSEQDKLVVEQQSINNEMQLTELMASNSRMGAQLESVNREFENYVETIQKSLESDSLSEEEMNQIKIAFSRNRGLDFIKDQILFIEENKQSIKEDYEAKLEEQSINFKNGLEEIATIVNAEEFQAIFNENSGLLETASSIENLKESINNYITKREQEFTNQLDSQLQNQENDYLEQLEVQREALLNQLQSQITQLRNEEEVKRTQAVNLAIKQQQEISLEKLKLAEEDKQKSLDELEKRLRDELKDLERVIELDNIAQDIQLPISWVHIPSIWESDNRELLYNGKKVDTIAWSREQFEDDSAIIFNGDYQNADENLIILYGSGRFKDWNSGIVINIVKTNSSLVRCNVFTNGLSETSKLIFSEEFNTGNGISGNYSISVIKGKLSLTLDKNTIVSDLDIPVEKIGKIGFGNRENISEPYTISNIELFKVR